MQQKVRTFNNFKLQQFKINYKTPDYTHKIDYNCLENIFDLNYLSDINFVSNKDFVAAY